MESEYPELPLCGRKNECARTDTVFIPISEVSEGTVFLTEQVCQRKKKKKLSQQRLVQMMYKFQFAEVEVQFLYCRWGRVWGRLVPLEILLLQQVATLQCTLHHTLNCTLYSRCTVHCTTGSNSALYIMCTVRCTLCVLYTVQLVYCTP